eukprot:4217100-Alexandrium_andersonii.AAC.1
MLKINMLGSLEVFVIDVRALSRALDTMGKTPPASAKKAADFVKARCALRHVFHELTPLFYTPGQPH